MSKQDFNLPPFVRVAAASFGKDYESMEQGSFEATLWIAGDTRVTQKRAMHPRMPWQQIAMKLSAQLPQNTVKEIVMDAIQRQEKGLNLIADDELPRANEIGEIGPKIIKAMTTKKSSGSKVVVDNLQVMVTGI